MDQESVQSTQPSPQSTELSTTPPSIQAPSSHAKLISALCKAQMEIFNPVKNKQVDVQGKEGRRGFGYEYAELNVVTEIIRQPLAKNGLAYTQAPINRGQNWYVVTRLMHESDEHFDFFYPIHPKQNMSAEQGFAAGFTYAKRQALKGIFGIADDTEDKDGQDDNPNAKITHKHVNQGPKSPPPQRKQSPPPDDIDAALAGDSHPDYENQPEPVTLLDQLVHLAEEKNIPHEQMKDIIKRCTGRSARAKELNTEELTRVIQYLNMLSKKTE